MRQILFLIACFCAAPVLALGPVDPYSKIPGTEGFEEDYEVKQWQELETRLPPAPRPENLQPFYVSAASEHRFFVDNDSISLGRDGVVRYTLVVRTSGGATNVSYEGMRCETREQRIYALGQVDGSWSKARSNKWVKIKDSVTNRQHAALFLEFFCPAGVIVGSVADARRLLRQGGAIGQVTVGR